MALTNKLTRYLEMERLVLSLDGDDDEAADVIRDLMDPLWYALTVDEKRFLDARSVGAVDVLEWLSVPISSCVYVRVPPIQNPIPTLEIRDWKTAA